MVSKDDLLRALPMRGLRADYGTKSSRTGGARAIVDLEPAAEFETVNAVPEEVVLTRWGPPPDLEHVLMCYDNVVLGVQEALLEHLGPDLPALRVVVHDVLAHPIESNEMNNQYVGRWVIQAALRRLDPDWSDA